MRRRELTPLHGPEHVADLALERWFSDQQAVERRPQAVHVRLRPKRLQVASRLLGAHVRRCSHHLPRQRLGRPARRRGNKRPLVRRQVLTTALGLGQAPVNNQRFAVPAHDDIARLYISVKNPTAVRVLDRVADVGEPPQQFPQFQRSAAVVALGDALL